MYPQQVQHQAGWCVRHREGRDAIQRNFDRLGRWINANLMRINKAKRKFLHSGHDNPRHINRLGRELVESSPMEKEQGMMVDENST